MKSLYLSIALVLALGLTVAVFSIADGVQAGYVTDIAVTGDYAYVTVGGYGLAVVDISDPLAPQEVGACEFPLPDGYPLAVAISGTMAYVGQEDDLRVVDVSSPTDPVEVGVTTIGDMNVGDSESRFSFLIEEETCQKRLYQLLFS